VSPQALAVWLALAAAAPEPLALPGFRLHLEVSEDVDPDLLGALANPGVVLWLNTRSNVLRRSTAERLARFDAVFVQVRPPFASGVRQQFTGRVHPRVDEDGLDVAAYRRWAPAGTAVDVAGELTEERLRRVLAPRPLAVRWRPEAAPTAEEWARAARLPGLEVHPSGPLPPCERPLKRAERMRLRVPAGDVDGAAPGCGFALRLEVLPSLSEAELGALLVAHPGAELWVRVASDADAAAAGALVRVLTAASPPAPRKQAPPVRTRDGGSP
jgi:hypothetical protein